MGTAPVTPRKIIHVDMDCFYAAVEIREHPQLAQRPVAVGGTASGRGVLTTCNYKAREFGLHSAMPAAQAFKRCPELVLLPVRMDLYRDTSRQIHAIFKRYTRLIEPLSLDEAYLDVSHSELHRGSATLIAQDIRRAILTEQQLTASAGIAANKFLAKVASDWNKPNGQFAIPPDKVANFMTVLPVKKIPGVGPVTWKRLSSLGVETCGQLQDFSLTALQQQFGRFGNALYHYARGEDDRLVSTGRRRKSLSVERTFVSDLTRPEAVQTVIPALYKELQSRLEKAQQPSTLCISSLFVKVKFSDFQVMTHQCIASVPNMPVYSGLLKHCLSQRSAAVRLVGLGIRFGLPDKPVQLSLF